MRLHEIDHRGKALADGQIDHEGFLERLPERADTGVKTDHAAPLSVRSSVCSSVAREMVPL